MKKLMSIVSALFFLSILSCKKSVDNNLIIDSSAQVASALSSGSWRITYYWDTDHDESINYAGYNFTFGNNKIVTAANGAFSLSGTWLTQFDNVYVKLVLAFTNPASYVEISDDWQVIETTSSKLKLQDISGGNGGTDYLTFEKN